MARTSQVYIDSKKAMELYKAGAGWREIGRALGGIHPYQIQIHFEKLGLKANNKVGGVREWDTTRAIDMDHCGLSVTKIAKELGVSQSTVYKFFRDIRNKEGE